MLTITTIFRVGENAEGDSRLKVLLINEVCGHTSTGRICGEIADKLSAEGHEVKIAYGRSAFVPEKYQTVYCNDYKPEDGEQTTLYRRLFPNLNGMAAMIMNICFYMLASGISHIKSR